MISVINQKGYNSPFVGFFPMLILTILGLYNGSVTVFYIIYLFWFQEILRTIISFLLVISPFLVLNFLVSRFHKPKVE